MQRYITHIDIYVWWRCDWKSVYFVICIVLFPIWVCKLILFNNNNNTYYFFNILIKKCIAWMHCKSLWIKVSAKCINVIIIIKKKQCLVLVHQCHSSIISSYFMVKVRLRSRDMVKTKYYKICRPRNTSNSPKSGLQHWLEISLGSDPWKPVEGSRGILCWASRIVVASSHGAVWVCQWLGWCLSKALLCLLDSTLFTRK